MRVVEAIDETTIRRYCAVTIDDISKSKVVVYKIMLCFRILYI